jgi:hypothetical protein
MLIDESDTFISDKSELRGVLNSGHNESQAFVVRTVGDNHEPKQFSTWAPKAFAGIGRIHPTLEDRSIKIELKRKLKTQHVERLPRNDDDFEALRRKCARWALDNLAKLADANPDMPQKLNDRAKDNWHPLLAIADLSGGEYPELARKAAIGLSGIDDDDEYGILLLKDIRELSRRDDTDRLSSDDIVAYLRDLQGRPWPEFKDGKPITTAGVARLLKPFKISPRHVRIGTDRTQGYHLEQFEWAFKRYLDGDSGVQRSDRSAKSTKSTGYADSKGLTDEKLSDPKNTANRLK